MESAPSRRTERACVGLYALVAVLSGLTYVWLSRPRSQPTPGEAVPAGSGAFAVVGLFWLCTLAASAMACVLLGVNAVRVRRGESADRVVVALSLAVPGGLLAALYVDLAAPASGLPLPLAVVALVVAPAGLFAATYGDRYRRGRDRAD